MMTSTGKKVMHKDTASSSSGSSGQRQLQWRQRQRRLRLLTAAPRDRGGASRTGRGGAATAALPR